MNGGADMMDGSTSVDEPGWWYRTSGGTAGPVSGTELRRLSAQGPLGDDTLVWRHGFGEHWRRLVDALAPAERVGPPSIDHGRWARSFAMSEAHPHRAQWSWLGLLGPLGYLCVGLWRRALVILAVAMLGELLFALGDYWHGSARHVLPGMVTASFCARNLKADLYAHRVLGQPMWPRLRWAGSGWVCGPLAAVVLTALVLVRLGNPADDLLRDMAGVWQDDAAAEVVIDVAGRAKSIAYNGETHLVRVDSLQDDAEGIVFADLVSGRPPITVRRHWSADHATYTLDLFEAGTLLANLGLSRHL